MKTKKNTKAKRIDEAALNEPIYDWLLRDCPEERWSVENNFPECFTFADAAKSLEEGWGIGEAENCDTAVREKIWKRLAKVLGERLASLERRADRRAEERERREARRCA